jgi:hypothetical protein
MNNLVNTLLILTIWLSCCFSSHSQTDPGITQIDKYCDSLDKIKDIQHLIKAGGGVTLDYIISNGELIKIIEHPAGYKFISAKETYYIKNFKPVYVDADIEISSEDGDKLTIELHKIYLDKNGILKYLISEQTFDADSLYNSRSNPLKTAESIRKYARFKSKCIDPKFEKTLLQAVDKYIKASNRKEGDPVFEELYSPFI